MNLHGRSLLKEIDFTAEEFRYLIDLGVRLRLERHMGQRTRRARSLPADSRSRPPTQVLA